MGKPEDIAAAAAFLASDEAGYITGDVMYIHNVLFRADETSARTSAEDIVDQLNLPEDLNLIFDENGHGTAPETQILKKGDIPVRPEDPGWDRIRRGAL